MKLIQTHSVGSDETAPYDVDDFDIPLEVLEKLDIYWNPPKNCPFEVHQSIMRQLNHCNRVIKYSHNIINFK